MSFYSFQEYTCLPCCTASHCPVPLCAQQNTPERASSPPGDGSAAVQICHLLTRKSAHYLSGDPTATGSSSWRARKREGRVHCQGIRQRQAALAEGQERGRAECIAHINSIGAWSTAMVWNSLEPYMSTNHWLEHWGMRQLCRSSTYSHNLQLLENTYALCYFMHYSHIWIYPWWYSSVLSDTPFR